MLKRFRYLVLGGALVVLCACDLGMGGDLDLGCFIFCPSIPVGYGLSPEGAHVLRGDTVSFYTWNCDGNSYVCGLQGNLASNWSITGDAGIAVLPNNTLTRTVSSAKEIVVRGIAVGVSEIRAVAAFDSSETRTVRLHVADSSAITQISLYAGRDTLPQGTYFVVSARLLDSAGYLYTAQPTDWSVSDTTVLELGQIVPNYDGSISRNVRARGPGSADLVVSFLGVSSVKRLTVLP